MNNYCKFLRKTLLSLAIMSDNKLFRHLANSNSQTHLGRVRIPVLQYGKLFGSHVLLNKRRLSGN